MGAQTSSPRRASPGQMARSRPARQRSLVALKVYGGSRAKSSLCCRLKAKPIARYELPSEIGHAIPNENIMLHNTSRIVR